MIDLISVTPEHVSPALTLREGEHVESFPIRMFGGNWNDGLFRTFRVQTRPPWRDRFVQVFPFVSEEWTPVIDHLLRFERDFWREWWQRRRSSARADDGISDFPPLLEQPEDLVRVIRIPVGGHSLPALIRPLIEWPDLYQHPMSFEERKTLWQRSLIPDLKEIWSALGIPISKLRLDLKAGDIDPWKFLSDGHRMAVTTWRLFHADFAHLTIHAEYRVILNGDEVHEIKLTREV